MTIYKEDTGPHGSIRYAKTKLGKGVQRKTFYKEFANKNSVVLDIDSKAPHYVEKIEVVIKMGIQ